MGHAAAFSFYPGKNLGAGGEPGAITTDDGQLAQTCRLLRDHGQSKKYFTTLKATLAGSIPFWPAFCGLSSDI
jgi:dTDP-4-amino-4,6-dideoxygalactose transaminase